MECPGQVLTTLPLPIHLLHMVDVESMGQAQEMHSLRVNRWAVGRHHLITTARNTTATTATLRVHIIGDTRCPGRTCIPREVSLLRLPPLPRLQTGSVTETETGRDRMTWVGHISGPTTRGRLITAPRTPLSSSMATGQGTMTSGVTQEGEVAEVMVGAPPLRTGRALAALDRKSVV